MPWSTICFTSALHGLPPLWQSSSTEKKTSGNSRSPKPKVSTRVTQPPNDLLTMAHQRFPKGFRRNLYRHDHGQHPFQSSPSNSSYALCRRGALYITSRQSSRRDYDRTRPSRLRSNPVNTIHRGNRIFSTIAPHRAAPLRCLSPRSQPVGDESAPQVTSRGPIQDKGRELLWSRSRNLFWGCVDARRPRFVADSTISASETIALHHMCLRAFDHRPLSHPPVLA